METINNTATIPSNRDLNRMNQTDFEEMEIENDTDLDEIESFFKNDFEEDFLEDDNF